MSPSAPPLIARPHMLLAPGAPILCPRVIGGHAHVVRHNAAILHQEALICQHRPAAGSAECGTRVFVLQVGHGWRYVVEITAREMLYLRDHQLEKSEALAYLGSLPPLTSTHQESAC